MMNGGSGAPNYRRQRPSQMGLDVGAQLAQRSQLMQPPGAPPAGGMAQPAAPMAAPAPTQSLDDEGFDPATEHSATSTRVALSEAVGRALSVRDPENPRFRSRAQRQQWKQLGIPDTEIAMLEANDPAIRED